MVGGYFGEHPPGKCFEISGDLRMLSGGPPQDAGIPADGVSRVDRRPALEAQTAWHGGDRSPGGQAVKRRRGIGEYHVDRTIEQFGSHDGDDRATEIEVRAAGEG